MNHHYNDALPSMIVSADHSLFRDFSDDYLNSVFNKNNESDESNSSQFSPKSDTSQGNNEPHFSGSTNLNSESKFSGFVDSNSFCLRTENFGSGSYCSDFTKMNNDAGQYHKVRENMNSSHKINIFDPVPLGLADVSTISDSCFVETGN